MESRAHAIIAGLFTVLLGIGVILAALWFSREDYDRVTYVLESKHSVSGLNPQAAVRLRGVQIGKVQTIEFDDEDPKLILITILVKGGSRITRGTSAQLGAQGITGTSSVMLEDDGKKPAQILASGVSLLWALKAQRLLAEEWGIGANVWSVTSWNELRRDGLDVNRHNLLHPHDPKQAYINEKLQNAQGPVVAVSDFMRAVQDQIAPWVSQSFLSLGTDGFGL